MDLSSLYTATQQGRTTWRHNSILEHIRTSIVQNKPEHLEVYADVPGCTINGATIPQDILIVSGEGSKPDLVLINRRETIVCELCCLFNYNKRVFNKKVPLTVGSDTPKWIFQKVTKHIPLVTYKIYIIIVIIRNHGKYLTLHKDALKTGNIFVFYPNKAWSNLSF